MNLSVDQVNAVFGPVFYIVLLLLTAAMGFRVFRHLRTRRRTPLLLARDFLLFVYLFVIIIAQQYARSTGVRLSDQLWWVLTTDLLGLAVLSLWLGIEYGVVRQVGVDCACPEHCPPGAHPEDEQ